MERNGDKVTKYSVGEIITSSTFTEVTRIVYELVIGLHVSLKKGEYVQLSATL